MAVKRIVLAIGVLLSMVAVLTGCTVSSTPVLTHPSPIKLTPEQLQDQINTYAEQIIGVTKGSWIFETNHAWDPNSLEYGIQSCDPYNLKDDSALFNIVIYGPPSKNPKVDAQTVADMWSKHGYPVQTVIPEQTQAGGKNYIEIKSQLSNGALLDYAVSTSSSSLLINTSCTSDPSVWDWYDARFPDPSSPTPTPTP